MRKWIGTVVASVLTVTGVWAESVSVDTWDMNDNGLNQISDNGVNLGAHYATNNQQFAQVDDDGLFLFAPTNASGYGSQIPLSSGSDLTAGIVTLSYTFDSVDWSTNAAESTKCGFRVYNAATTNYVGIELLDSNDKLFAFTKSSAGLGGVNNKAGRLAVGLVGSDSRTITLELDYANSEVRMSGNWQWSPGGQVTFTNAVDFAAAGVTEIDRIRTYYAKWSAEDKISSDELSVGYISSAPPKGVYVSESASFNISNAAVTNTFANLTVANGDYVVVEASASKGGWNAETAVTFGGTASLGATVYDVEESGARAHLWYVPVTADGTVDVTVKVVPSEELRAPVVAYVVRSSTGGLDLLGTASTKIGAAESLSITNVYEFGASATGLFIEAMASYASDGNGISSDNASYVIGGADGDRRMVGHGTFAGVASLTNIWTATTNRQAAVIGIAFMASDLSTPTSQYEYFLSAGTDVGSATGLQDHGDSDGLDNLTEYAFGGDAGDPAVQGNTPVQSQVADGGINYIQYIYFERDDAADRGLASILNVGTSLAIPNWTTAGIEFVGSGASAVSGFNAVTNRISTDADDTRFLRLQIEFTP